jgi:RNA polymerase-binding transcription factor DksA
MRSQPTATNGKRPFALLRLARFARGGNTRSLVVALRHFAPTSCWIAREHDERTAAIHVARDRGGADFGDTAEDERENRGLIAQLSIEEAELREIEAALGRIRDGTYGRCEATGHPISAVRLRAVPWTRLSRNAAAKGENRLRLPRAK